MNSTPSLPPAEEEQKDNNGNVLDGIGGGGDLNDVATATDILSDAIEGAKEALEHLGDIVDGVFSGLP